MTLIQGYVATYGTYPLKSESGLIIRCATTDNYCTGSNAIQNITPNADLMAELSKIGTPPQSAGQGVSSGEYGIQYIYLPASNNPTLNNAPAPVRIEYRLIGNAVNCGVQNVAAAVSNSGNVVSSTTGYTSTHSDFTRCDVRL